MAGHGGFFPGNGFRHACYGRRVLEHTGSCLPQQKGRLVAAYRSEGFCPWYWQNDSHVFLIKGKDQRVWYSEIVSLRMRSCRRFTVVGVFSVPGQCLTEPGSKT